MPSQTPSPFTSRFQLSTADFQLFRANSFRLIQFRKNASANPLESHTFKTKDLKPFRFTHFQKSGRGEGVYARQDANHELTLQDDGSRDDMILRPSSGRGTEVRK